jgi:hypothetical protein
MSVKGSMRESERRFEEVIEQARLAVESDPLSNRFSSALGEFIIKPIPHAAVRVERIL